MGVSIPTSYDVLIDAPLPPVTVSKIGAVGPVTVDGIPDTFHINIDKLPKIQLGVDPVTINPVDVTIGISKIPDIRAHLPADFSVGLSLLGMELMCLRLCGEAQMITEPYHPNPCEVCGEPRRQVSQLEPATVRHPEG
ncbi:MAG: hypothetical protein ACJ74B_02535 [Gaiellaceae bacterium]